MRAVLVEDDSTNDTVIHAQLQDTSYAAGCINNRQTALSTLDIHYDALVLLDLSLLGKYSLNELNAFAPKPVQVIYRLSLHGTGWAIDCVVWMIGLTTMCSFEKTCPPCFYQARQFLLLSIATPTYSKRYLCPHPLFLRNKRRNGWHAVHVFKRTSLCFLPSDLKVLTVLHRKGHGNWRHLRVFIRSMLQGDLTDSLAVAARRMT